MKLTPDFSNHARLDKKLFHQKLIQFTLFISGLVGVIYFRWKSKKGAMWDKSIHIMFTYACNSNSKKFRYKIIYFTIWIMGKTDGELNNNWGFDLLKYFHWMAVKTRTILYCVIWPANPCKSKSYFGCFATFPIKIKRRKKYIQK